MRLITSMPTNTPNGMNIIPTLCYIYPTYGSAFGSRTGLYIPIILAFYLSDCFFISFLYCFSFYVLFFSFVCFLPCETDDNGRR